MRKKTTTIFLSAAVLSLLPMIQVDAQSKIGLESRMQLMREQHQKHSPVVRSLPSVAAQPALGGRRRLVLIETDTQEAVQRLAEAGAEVLRMRGSIALCAVATDSLDQVAAFDCVRRLEFGRKFQTKMDRARQLTGIDYIHQGNELPQAYTGKGVVTGIVDYGFEPNHVNFLRPDGSTRVGYMSRIYQTTTNAEGYIYEDYYPKDSLPIYDEEGNLTPSLPIEEFTTDTREDYHGTHTLGIMAGSYRGTVQAAVLNEQGQVSVQTLDNPYYGAATESEIVISSGDLLEEYICYGLEDIVNYATFSGGYDTEGNPVAPKPCVINLSLGTCLGPHDPNTLMNKYLSEFGKEAILCLASGNEGDLVIALEKEFAGEDLSLQSFIVPQEQYAGAYTEDGVNVFHNIRAGSIYVYADDVNPVDVQVVIYNTKRNSIAMRMAVGTESAGILKSWASSSDYDVYGNAITNNATFNKSFEGYVAAGGTIDESLGRYMTIIEYYLTDNQSTNADSNYKLGLVITGQDGQRVCAYGDGVCTEFSALNVEGWVNGSHDGTISDLACADNVLAVGAYNVRNRWASLDGNAYAFTEDPLTDGDITFFSSYGTMRDGHTLPHVCAPGATIISSVNAFYVDNMLQDSDLQASCVANDSHYYWQASLGTSMSSPVVAGAIALWLEADPTLTIDDVKEIIRETSVVDQYVLNGIPAQWGAGKFDAYAGLKEVLRRKAQGIEAVQSSPSLAGLYTLSGVLVRSLDYADDATHIDTSGLPQGFYALHMKDGRTCKIYVY